MGTFSENFQTWTLSGEFCPEGTIPIRRTREEDMLRASSVRRFGRKIRGIVRRNSNSNGHEVLPCLQTQNNFLFYLFYKSVMHI